MGDRELDRLELAVVELERETRRTIVAVLAVLALLAWALWPSSAAAQVAGLCGPGKNCQVSRLRATSTNNSVSIPADGLVCMDGAQPAATCSYYARYNSSAGVVQVVAGGTGVLTIGTAGALHSGYLSGTLGISTGSAAAGVAFASFPACAAGTNGRMLFDSTNNVWRTCINGQGWHALQRLTSDSNITWVPASGVTANVTLGAFSLGGGIYGTEAQHSVNALGTVVTAGSGAGSAVYTLYNESAGTSTGVTVTCTCNAGAGSTCTPAGVPYVITDDNLALSWRLTTDCATTRPAVNLSVNVVFQSY